MLSSAGVFLGMAACCLVSTQGFMLTGRSCAGVCFDTYQPPLPCQCNSQCQSHGNCCSDFAALCLGGHTASPHGGSSHTTGDVITCNSAFTDVTEALWSNDVNRLDASLFTLNLQTRVSESNHADRSTAPLFTSVDAAALSSRPTFKTFLALQDNYEAVAGRGDAPSQHESHEVSAFLDAALATPVMKILLQYLQCRHVLSDLAHLRQKLTEMWFTPYSRHSGGHADSSGFEHVMVGEYKSSSTVNGLHNWLAYYTKERAHQINYYGFVGQANPSLVAVNFDWSGRIKSLGSFFVGTSPEFELALYSLCALTQPGQHPCSVRLQGSTVRLTIWDLDHLSGFQIASAYPTF